MKKDKLDNTKLNSVLKPIQLKENGSNSSIKQILSKQSFQKSAQFNQSNLFQNKDGNSIMKQGNYPQQYSFEKQRLKFQSTHQKNSLTINNFNPTQKSDQHIFLPNQLSSLALLARNKDETLLLSSALTIRNNQASIGSVNDKQNSLNNQITSTLGENSTKSNLKFTMTNNSFSQEIFNIHKKPIQIDDKSKGFLFSNKDYLPRNTNSQYLFKKRNGSSDMKEQVINEEQPFREFNGSNHKKYQNPVRERRVFSKSLAKVNNTDYDQQDQSDLAYLDKLKVSIIGSTQNNQFLQKSSQSTYKTSFYKDISHSQSTAVSFKKSFNVSNADKFPQLQLNMAQDITSQIENKANQYLYRSVSQKRAPKINPFQLKNQYYNAQNASFMNQSKDKAMDFSFLKTPNGLQSIQVTDRNVGNELSQIEPDSILLQSNDFFSRDKNLSNSIAANSTKDQSILEQTDKYLNKFIKLNPYLLTQEEKLKKLQQLKQKQYQILQNVQKRNFEDAINILKEFLTQSSKFKNLENFGESIAFIGQLHYFNHDLDNALYSFLQLKNLSEIVGSPSLKMKSLILLGQLLQDEQDYDLAIFMYRRAIHYSWYLNDCQAETELFDKLGFLYFMKGDIQKAKYFHDRSIQHQSENPNSENRQQSVYTIAKQYQNPEKFIPTLNQMVLAKLGLLTDQQDQLRFSTKLSADLQLIILKEDKEINFANHDPNEINPEDLIYSKVIPDGMDNLKEYQIIQKILNQKNSFQPIVKKFSKYYEIILIFVLFEKVLRNTQYKDPQSQKIVDQSMLKLTIEEKVEKVKMDVYDNERLQKKIKEAQVSALINRSSKNQIFFYNHCSPNRNLLGFKYTFRPNSLKFKNYFNKMEEMILQSEN